MLIIEKKRIYKCGAKIVDKTNKIIFFIIILQPVVDIITSLSTTYLNSTITLGMIFRTVILFTLIIYTSHYFLYHKRSLLLLYLLSLMSVFVSFVVNYFSKEYYLLFKEINFAFKTTYYLMIIFTTIIFIDRKLINREMIYRATNIISMVIGFSYWLAILTNTEVNSYLYEEVGYSGWFYSANELSVTVIILLGLAIINIHTNKKSLNHWIAFMLMLSMVPMIGTKTAFFGGLLLVCIYWIYLLYEIRLHIWKERNVIIYSFILLIFLCTLPISPIISNTKERGYFSSDDQNIKKITTHTKDGSSGLIHKVLSSRDIYLDKVKSDYAKASPFRKAVGLGFSGDYKKEPKLIEMDFFDLFFSYGFIGATILLLSLLYVLKKIFLFPKNIKIALTLLTLGLCLGISFLAGHVLFAPSVMTYLGMLFVILDVEGTQEMKSYV